MMSNIVPFKTDRATTPKRVNGKVPTRPKKAVVWTPPHLTGIAMCQTESECFQSQVEGVRDEAYSRRNRFGKEHLSGTRG